MKPFRSQKNPARTRKNVKTKSGAMHCVCSKCKHDASAPSGKTHRGCGGTWGPV